MALNQEWLQKILRYEADLSAPEGSDRTICRALIDGVLVVYDLDDPPAWLVPILEARDEDGNTQVSGVSRERAQDPPDVPSTVYTRD